MTLLKTFLILLIRLYRAVFSPVCRTLFGPMGLGCRYQPTCSQYALDALQGHGAFKGSLLTLCRLCRCHPWGGSGFDPVPPPRKSRSPAGAPFRTVDSPAHHPLCPPADTTVDQHP